MRIALLQAQSVVGDPNKNISLIRDAAKKSAQNKASLLITPELFITGYGAADKLITQSIVPNGADLDELCGISKEYDIALVVGFPERSGDVIYNSAALIDKGALIICYRKCQLWGEYEERFFKAEKPNPMIVDFQGLKLGMLICYDVEFPERVRELAVAGADLICVPTATPSGVSADFIANHMIRVRAFENQLFIAYVNHHSFDGRFEYAGLSCVAAPNGDFLAQAGTDADELLFVDIESDSYIEECKETPYLKDLVQP